MSGRAAGCAATCTAALCLVLLVGMVPERAVAASGIVPARGLDLGRQPLPANDGFAAANGGVDNVIIRNLTLKNACDCFPRWDPTDTSAGNWNSEFDNITIINNATHVWVDHNTFTDQPYPDSAEPTCFGRPFQQHDGATDITDGSGDVTVPWNVYAGHDKLMLIGSTTSNKFGDADHLHVTIHHNEFAGIGQRASRLRWGQNDLYDNYYVEPGDGAVGYVYSWGGTVIHAADNLVNGRQTDILAAYNAANPGALISDDTSWTPVYRDHVDPPLAVPALVGHWAGAGRAG